MGNTLLFKGMIFETNLEWQLSKVIFENFAISVDSEVGIQELPRGIQPKS